MNSPAASAELLAAVEAAQHEWSVLPRWKRVEIERQAQAEFVYSKVRRVQLPGRCEKCRGSGLQAGYGEYTTDSCSDCGGTGQRLPTMTQVRELIK